MRTAEGLGVQQIIFSGYTPYPQTENDRRLPHEAAKLTKQIHKTALGAELMVKWTRHENILPVIEKLKKSGYIIAALEQTDDAKELPKYHAPHKIVLILGREVEGLEQEILDACDVALEIPMFGKKESYNVVEAASMAMYHCRFSAEA
jgi:tRNA G18 (ribose-2'-O)-methylase SpoU